MTYALEIEEVEQSNVISFKKPKIYTIHRLDKAAHLFNHLENQIAIVDLFVNTASDHELHQLVVNLSNLPLPYPKGFNRDLATEILNKLKLEQPALVANYGLNLLTAWVKESKNIGFVLKNNQTIHCFFMMIEDEPNHSLFIQIALRGTHIEKTRSACSFLKLWHNGYLRYWFDKGYRYIWANSFTPKGKEFINQAGAKEDKHIFFSRQANKTVRYNGSYHWMMDARWDLKKKFEGKDK
jgi:hypothetical protein